MIKKEYTVSLPITGVAYVDVKAESEEEALSIALQTVNDTHLESWEAHEYITQGNVFYGDLNEYDVIEVEE